MRSQRNLDEIRDHCISEREFCHWQNRIHLKPFQISPFDQRNSYKILNFTPTDCGDSSCLWRQRSTAAVFFCFQLRKFPFFSETTTRITVSDMKTNCVYCYESRSLFWFWCGTESQSGKIHTFQTTHQLRLHIMSPLSKDIGFNLRHRLHIQQGSLIFSYKHCMTETAHLLKCKTSSSIWREEKFGHPLFPSVLFCFFILAVVTMTQTCHDALDPYCAKRQSKYSPSPGGNRPGAVLSIHHTITKWIFDSDLRSNFLSPATPWRTKQFSCYPWTVRKTLNSTPWHLSEHKGVWLVKSCRRKVDSKAK